MSNDGIVRSYIERMINHPYAVRGTSDDGFYVLSSGGMVTRVDRDGGVKKILSGGQTYGLALDGQGNLYTSDTYKNEIIKISPQGEVARIAVEFRPGALTVTHDGSLLVAQWGGRDIYRMKVSGEFVKYFVTDYAIYQDILADKFGILWIPHASNSRITRIDADGIKKVYRVPYSPHGVNSDGVGGVYIGGYEGVTHISESGVVDSIKYPALKGQTQVGAVTGTDGTLTTVDTLGQVSRFDAKGDLILKNPHEREP